MVLSEEAREGLELIRRIKTWYLEWLVVGSLLLTVAWATRGLDWGVVVWLVSTLLNHGVRSISSRQKELHEARGLSSMLEAHEVSCWAWAAWYSFVLAVLGGGVAVYRQEWHGLTALAVAVAYPWWRRLYRHLCPVVEADWSRESD